MTKAQVEHVDRNNSMQMELERSREQLKAAPSMADQQQKSRDVERLSVSLRQKLGKYGGWRRHCVKDKSFLSFSFISFFILMNDLWGCCHLFVCVPLVLVVA